jgi:hypothetical protein
VDVVWVLSLDGELAVLQAPMLDGLSLDPFALLDDGRRPTEIGACRRHIVQALVVALVVVVLDEQTVPSLSAYATTQVDPLLRVNRAPSRYSAIQIAW